MLKLKSQNHKKITYRKHQKSQITEKLLKNQTKKSQKKHVISKSQKSLGRVWREKRESF